MTTRTITFQEYFRALPEAEQQMLILRWSREISPTDIEHLLGLRRGSVLPLLGRICHRACTAVRRWGDPTRHGRGE